MGRPRLKGRRWPKFAAVLANPKTVWSPINVTEWYGGRQRKLEIVSGAAVWYPSGLPPAPIRWVLVRDPSGEREPQAFLSTTSRPSRSKSSAGSSHVGAWRQRFRKRGPISAWRR